ncbi:hypothetical protein QJQ45_018488, partial [Haematococcus lacustris]
SQRSAMQTCARSASSHRSVYHFRRSAVTPHLARRMAASASRKTVLVPIANGSEEMEAVIIIDVLRRAGAEVTVASVENELVVTCSRGVKLQADVSMDSAASSTYDVIALPGGMPGAERLRDCGALERLLREQAAAGRHTAAICATPTVFLEAKGLVGEGAKVTAHPAFADKLKNQSAVSERVVVDGLLTTSRGPGTAFEFALSLVKQLYGEEKLQAVAAPMVMYPFSV